MTTNLLELRKRVRQQDGAALAPGACPMCDGEGWYAIDFGANPRFDGNADKGRDCEHCGGTGFEPETHSPDSRKEAAKND